MTGFFWKTYLEWSGCLIQHGATVDLVRNPSRHQVEHTGVPLPSNTMTYISKGMLTNSIYTKGCLLWNLLTLKRLSQMSYHEFDLSQIIWHSLTLGPMKPRRGHVNFELFWVQSGSLMSRAWSRDERALWWNLAVPRTGQSYKISYFLTKNRPKTRLTLRTTSPVRGLGTQIRRKILKFQDSGQILRTIWSSSSHWT